MTSTALGLSDLGLLLLCPDKQTSKCWFTSSDFGSNSSQLGQRMVAGAAESELDWREERRSS